MDDAFTARLDLASRALGGGVVHANDEFFAAADHLVLPEPPTFSPRTFDHKGQVYDGWETRRRRTPGSDVAIVRLGAPGVIHGVDVDTSFFVGNFPPFASLDGLAVDGHQVPPDAAWTALVPKSPLNGDSRNLFAVSDRRRFTHVRLTIFPDGGVARLRVHGEAIPDPALLPAEFDVAAVTAGATVTGCSNMFFGRPHQMLMPGLARHMGDGWETARRREDGNEWAEIELAAPTEVTFVDLDTSHFKGNAPGAAALRGTDGSGDWFDILPRVPLSPDTPHRFPVRPESPASRVRLDIYPDGGMARLRIIGRPDRAFLTEKFRRHTEESRRP
ncbi:allantoicase [Paractinoplanes rishiriensis]|uniref:Probable allantoicase n=1 Tax=Paractinoplanes rishiriensis TaxID=1050105 RepID=A0A919JSY3_9ACTN|nr:allantoicase [Actinoplanes rishiriensis]GIE92777.1 putative allantoicase [Actinoplanes rishiriensis]